MYAKHRGIIIPAAVFVVFFSVFFGIVGFRMSLGYFFVYFLPFLVFFDILGLEKRDTYIYSALLSLALLSTVVFYGGFVMPFKIAILLAPFTIIGLSAGIALYKKKKQKHI